MSLNIAFTEDAKQFFEEHTAADLGFNCEITNNVLSKEHIAQNKEIQEQYLQMKNKNDGTWENFLKDQPPFDRYLCERRLTQRVLSKIFSFGECVFKEQSYWGCSIRITASPLPKFCKSLKSKSANPS